MNNDFDKLQNFSYLNQNLVFEHSSIITILCQDCHGGDENAQGQSELMASYDPINIIHQENHPQFIAGLESFLISHNESEALKKFVVRQKVVDYIALH